LCQILSEGASWQILKRIKITFYFYSFNIKTVIGTGIMLLIRN